MEESKVSVSGLRNEDALTAEQKLEILDYAESLGMPEERIRFTEHDVTAYGALFDWLKVGTDVLPAPHPPGQGTHTANSRISWRGAIAHELTGHREAALRGETQLEEYLEEAQASIRAARFAPLLNSLERFILLRDAISRLRRAGVKIKEVKRSLFIVS